MACKPHLAHLLPALCVPFLCFAPSSHTCHLFSVTLTCTFVLASKPLHLLFLLLGVIFLAVSTWLIFLSASGLSSDTHSTQRLPCRPTPSKGASPYDPHNPPGAHYHMNLFTWLQNTLLSEMIFAYFFFIDCFVSHFRIQRSSRT